MSIARRPAILIVDMVKDNFDPNQNLKITPRATKIIEPINRLISVFREKGWPIIFPTDSYRKEDFIFTGRMGPTSLEGTEGAQVIDELDKRPEDLWLPKRRFSAFFGTGLEEYMYKEKITICAVTGISTPVCVLTTALDAVCYDFESVIISDCSASASEKIHEDTLNLYKKTPLYPLLRVNTSSEFLSDMETR